MQLPAEYLKLLERSEEISLLGSTAAVLRWDQSTHLPSRAGEFRAKQSAHLDGMIHKLFTAGEIGAWISACEQAGLAAIPPNDADPKVLAASTNVRGWRRDYDAATKLPQRLVEDLAQTTGEAYSVWVEAREKSDFALFSPWFQKILTLKREEAERLGYKESRYDALLDQYEIGATTRQLKPVFAQTQESLRDLVPKLTARTAKAVPPPGPFSEADQESFNEVVSRAIGYDFTSGRIDTTIHPFSTTLGPSDQRILTRYQADDFLVSFYGILHEAGHALYNQGLVKDYYGVPAGETISLGIHESQSRLWENQVGRSRSFWNHWMTEAVKHFPSLSGYSAEELWLWSNRVRPSFIRVEADEATYHLHVALRFEVEQALFNGGLEASDVPAFWNERFKHLMGITVPDDAHGCLQDVHWCSGLFGYFPTYSLGSFNAAQLFAKAEEQDPAISGELAQGQYTSLLAWLRKNVHEHGRRFTPDELMAKATGETTNPKYFFEYMATKFV